MQIEKLGLKKKKLIVKMNLRYKEEKISIEETSKIYVVVKCFIDVEMQKCTILLLK